MFPQLIRIAKLLFFASWAVFAAGFLIIGALFLYQMSNTYGRTVVVAAPSGKWSVALQEVSFTARHMKTAVVTVHQGPMTGHELICRMDHPMSDRKVFDRMIATQWRDGELKLDWTAGEPPVQGTLDIAAQCSDTAVFDDRPSGTSLRFHETCIVPGCARWIEWIDAGEMMTSTPCRTAARGDGPVFTLRGDVRGQIDVTLDPKARIATWTSRGTGQSGRVAFGEDCDTAREVRSPRPS